MSALQTESIFYAIKNANTPESIGGTERGLAFNKMWLYPASAVASDTGLLTANGAQILVGERTSGGIITPDPLQPTDLPMKIELPQGRTKLVRDVFIQGNVGDGVWAKFWLA